MSYIRTKPSNGYVVEFCGHTETSNTDLRHCVPYLNERYYNALAFYRSLDSGFWLGLAGS